MKHDILISDSELWSVHWAPSFGDFSGCRRGRTSQHFARLTTERRREAASATLRSHKTCLNLGFKLCHARAPHHGSSRTYPASLVDVGRVRRPGPEPSIHRLVDVWVRMHEWRRPIRHFPTPCVTLWSAGCLSYQRLNVRADLRHVPIRELGVPSCLRRSQSGGGAAHYVTAIVIMYRRDGT